MPGPFTFDEFGRDGIGINQSQSGLDYPFVFPSSDVRYLLADAYLAYDDPADYAAGVPWALPFSLYWLHGLGILSQSPPAGASTPTHVVDLQIQDANGRLVFDSPGATTFSTKVWSNRLTVYEWQTATAVCRIVVNTAWSSSEDAPPPQDYAVNIAPVNGVLDSRTIYRLPKRVRSITVGETTLKQLPQLDFVAGYNMGIALPPITNIAGGRFSTQVEFNATAGAGLGIFTDCSGTSPPPILTINGAAPSDSGQFLLAATDCYYTRRPTTGILGVSVVPTASINPMAAHLELGNDCTQPCCQCSDYVAAYERLLNLRNEYVVIGNSIETTRVKQVANVARWETVAACVNNHPVRVAMLSQQCPAIDIAAQFNNQTANCRTNIQLQIAFTVTPSVSPDPDVVCGHTLITTPLNEQVAYTLGGSWPTYTATWDNVTAFQASEIRFRLRLPNEGLSGMTPYSVTATITATENSIAIPGSVVQTTTLTCPASDFTEEGCV